MSRKQSHLLVAVCGGAFAVVLVANVAQAQVPPQQQMPDVLLEQQRKSEEQKKFQEEITKPQLPAEIEKPSPSPPPSPGIARTQTQVTQFKFSGNKAISTAELEKVVAADVGKVMTVGDMNAVARRVSNYYLSKGYLLGQAYLPPQEIRGGVVEIAVLEGKIGAIDVSGNERYPSSTILRRMESVKRGQVVKESTLETALNDLNDYPGLRVRADVKPGTERGTADIHLTAKERLPYTVGTDINNYGSRFTGPWLYSADLGIGNLTKLGDNLTFRGTKSDDNLFFTYINYLIPVNSYGTKLQMSWAHSENVLGAEFAFLRPVGRADIVSFDVLQTITRTSRFGLTGFAGFDYKTVRNIVAGDLLSKDELRIFRLGVRGDFRDPFLGRTYFGLTWHHGVDLLGGAEQDAPKTSFSGLGPGNWDKATADFARYQSLGFPFIQNVPVLPKVLNDSYLLVRATGQIAGDRLLSPERLAIGGYYTVRGYPVAELIGDSGYTATAELTVPVPSDAKIPYTSQTWKQVFQFSTFVDHGAVYATPISLPQGGFGSLTGAGGGLRINLPFGLPAPADRGGLVLKIEWASAIGRPRPTSRDQGLTIHPITGPGDPGVLYVSATMRF